MTIGEWRSEQNEFASVGDSVGVQLMGMAGGDRTIAGVHKLK